MPIYDDRYIKTKIRKFGDKVYTKFPSWTVPENDVECESFTFITLFTRIQEKMLSASIFRQLCL